jgi:hypothetical protein
MEEKFRVKVDASARIVEVEGPEPFVREMLDRYGTVIESSPGKAARGKAKQKPTGKLPAARRTPEVAQPKKARARGVQVDEQLMERLAEHGPALAAYLEARNVASKKEEAAIIASFLASKLTHSSMNDTQYVTVLRSLGRLLPKNPRQVLLDAKNKKHFFYGEGDSFKLTTTGINFVEHDSLKEKTSE